MFDAKAYKKAYRALHLEECRARDAAYLASHREEKKAYLVAYRASHRAKANIYQKAYAAAHKLERMAYVKRYRTAHPEKRKIYSDRYRRNTLPVRIEQTRTILASFRSGGCCICGEMDPACLQAHHDDPASKDYNIGQVVSQGNFKRLVAELPKCICVCSNCHWKIHRQDF